MYKKDFSLPEQRPTICAGQTIIARFDVGQDYNGGTDCQITL